MEHLEIVEMTHDARLGQLAAALAKAQGEMRPAKKESKNPFFKSNYADLAAIWESIRGPLAKNGLAVVQSPEILPDGKPVLRTTVLHSGGGSVTCVVPIIAAKADAQGYGAALTYACRQGLHITGACSTDEDDDGEAAVGRTASAQARNVISEANPLEDVPLIATPPSVTEFAQDIGATVETHAVAPARVDAGELKHLHTRAKKNGYPPAVMTKIIASVGAKSSKDLTHGQYARVMDLIDHQFNAAEMGV